MNCSQCGTSNETSSRFCLRCGAALVVPATTVPPTTFAQPTAPQSSQPPATWAQPTTPQSYPQYQAPVGYGPQSGYPLRPYYGASGIAGLNIWGPFAGYGTRRRHVGWLMDGEGARASDLLIRVESKYKEREIPGSQLTKENLTGRGVIVETRPYFVLRRGLASLALYISQFGNDLFISMASYLKPPISNFRLLLAGSMLVFQFFMTFVFPFAMSGAMGSLSNALNPFGPSSGGGLGPLLFISCVIGPLGALNSFALFLLLGFSLYKWLTEKDFLAALRVPPNEFNEDDLMAMEKAVETTVRQSLTDLKLNPDALQMATTGRGTGGQLF